MNYKRLQVVSFLALLLVVFALVVWIIKPMLSIIAFGIILAILFKPLHARFEKKMGNMWAAALTVLIIVLIILVPLLLFGQILFNEILDVYRRFASGDLVMSKDQIVQSIPPQLQVVIENVSRDLNTFLSQVTSHAFQNLSAFVSNVFGFFISAFLLFFTVYYLLRDAKSIKNVFYDISPLASAQENVLIEKISMAVNGVVKGAFLIALIQGFVATIGFLIFGVPQPFLWGLFTVLAALVPTIGTSLSLIPAVIYLLITGHAGAAIGLAIWGALAVGLIDNAVGPKIVGSKTKLHPLLVLFSVIGGLQFFGILGFLLGPILMAVFVALLDIYRSDFKSQLEQ